MKKQVAMNKPCWCEQLYENIFNCLCEDKVSIDADNPACPLGYERIKSLGVHRNICIILCKWSGSCLVKVVYKSTE